MITCAGSQMILRIRRYWKGYVIVARWPYVRDILNQNNQDVQLWIPVTEGLPELNMDVLVAVRDFGEDTSTSIDCVVEHNGKPMWSMFNGATEQELAWRLLPERYQPTDKGGEKPPSRIETVNDLDGDVVNFFRVIQNPETCRELQEWLTYTPYSRQVIEQAGTLRSDLKAYR